jgi:hypothetical protein
MIVLLIILLLRTNRMACLIYGKNHAKLVGFDER